MRNHRASARRGERANLSAGTAWRTVLVAGAGLLLAGTPACDVDDLTGGGPAMPAAGDGGNTPPGDAGVRSDGGGGGADLAIPCAPGLSRCGADCVNLTDNAAHCGGCARACPQGQLCVAGQCLDCQPGLTRCSGACVDLAADARNCGACGTACVAMQMCAEGKCTCAAGLTLCNKTCVDLATDNDNCGRCGNNCFIQRCGMGQCGGGNGCRPGQALCGNLCVDLNGDSANCGRCGNACQPGHICLFGNCL